MLEIFQYDFMQKAFLVGILVSIITPCIGVVIVLKRMSMIGDSLSHASLAGVAAGLVAGLNPIVVAAITSVAAALGIEALRKSFPKHTEISIAIIMSAGVGLAGVISGFVRNSTSFSNFLFGSIVAISDFELYTTVALGAVVIFTVLFLYNELYYITFDEEAARLAGVLVAFINTVFMIVTAVTISVAARTVGALIISSLMVIPVATAMQVAKSYKQTVVLSVVFSVFSMVVGLFVSYYANLRPGATIVLVSVLLLLLTIIWRGITNKARAPY